MKNLSKALLLIPALFMAACASKGEAIKDEDRYPGSVLNSKWGLEAAKASYDVLGVAIPYIECEGFDYEIGVDDFGDKDIWFYCYYNTDEEAYQSYVDYLTICSNRGYSGDETTYHNFDYENLVITEFQYCVVDRVIGENKGVELQFVTSTWKEKPCLGIYGFSYLYVEKDTYPQLAVEKFYKDPSDIPVISGEDYEYYFTFYIQDDGTQGLEIQVSYADYDIEKWYTQELLKTGNYAIIQFMDEDENYQELIEEYDEFMYGTYYTAVSNTKMIIYYYDLFKGIFVIDLYNRTPVIHH